MNIIKINDKEYEISIIDTEESLKNKIAFKEGTIPKHVKFIEFNLYSGNVKISLLSNILKKIKENNLIDEIPKIQKEWNISSTDIALEWLYVKQNGVLGEYDLAIASIFGKINEKDFGNFDNIILLSENYIEKKTETIKNLKEIINNEIVLANEYNKYEKYESTTFLQDSIIIDYEIEINTDELDTFNNIVLTNEIPFVRLTKGKIYYKIIDKVPIESLNEWIEGDEMFMFKLVQKEEWSTITLKYTDTNKAILTIEANIDSEKYNDEAILNKIKLILTDTKITIINRQENGIKGNVAFPNITISRSVFLDLITNDELVSHFLNIDETRELSSLKSVLYLYFLPTDNETMITSFLSERLVKHSDKFFISKELALYTPYLNIRISRAKNLNQVNRFIDIFSIILNIYKDKFKSIVNRYDLLIPNFKENNKLQKKEIDTTTTSQLKNLQLQNSELFIHKYASKCQKERQPNPIKPTKKELKDMESKGNKILEYPLDSKQYYICDNKTGYDFPGLQENHLDNNDVYPYLPCCFKNDRTTKNIKVIKPNKKLLKPTNIVTKKAITNGKIGYLPRNVYHILNKHATDKEQFYRQGVSIGTNSFIEAVMLGIDKIYTDELDLEKKKMYIQDFRNNLASNMTSSSQQLYNINAEQFTRDILDENIVFDSKLYIGLLENHYACQIIIFERNDEYPNGNIEMPKYTQGNLYRLLDPKKNTILIYKHYGIKSNNLEYPHYELIIKKSKNSITTYFTDDIVQTIYSYFLSVYKLYNIGIKRYAPFNIDLPIIGQFIDLYGKCRGYIFDNDILILTSPITPNNEINILEKPKTMAIWKNVKNFLKDLNIKIINQDISNNQAIGVTIDIPYITYAYIPFEPEPIIKNIQQAKNLPFSISITEDLLQKTFDNKKIANFLIQFLIYSFSLWYSDKIQEPNNVKKLEEIELLTIAQKIVKEKEFLLKNLDKFIKEKIIIIDNHDYDLTNLPRRLSINNKFFSETKLVVDSEETFKRASNYLIYFVIKNRAIAVNYSMRLYLDDFFTFSNDFKKHSNQLVFINTISIKSWIESKEKNIINKVETTIKNNIQYPYFFTHWSINSGYPIIFQNVRNGSLSRVLSISQTYTEKGFNTGFDTLPIKIDKITFTTYYMKNGIIIKEGHNPHNLVWRFNDNEYASILIPKGHAVL